MNDAFIKQKDPKNCVVVSEDTDVILLLTTLTPKDKTIYFLKPPKGKQPEKAYSSQNILKYIEKGETTEYSNATQHILFYVLFLAAIRRQRYFKKVS